HHAVIGEVPQANLNFAETISQSANLELAAHIQNSFAYVECCDHLFPPGEESEIAGKRFLATHRRSPNRLQLDSNRRSLTASDVSVRLSSSPTRNQITQSGSVRSQPALIIHLQDNQNHTRTLSYWLAW